MPIAKLRQDHLPHQAAQPAPQFTNELAGFVPTHSPARALQRQLVQRAVAARASDTAKWSPRRSLALIVTASAALWMAILTAGVEATKLVA